MVSIEGFGVYTLISPLTARATDVLIKSLETTPIQWMGGRLLVSSEYLSEIVGSLTRCGIQVKNKAGSAEYVSERAIRAAATAVQEERAKR